MDFGKYAKSILKSTRESTVGLAMDLQFDIVEFIKKELNKTGMNQKTLALKMKMKDSQLTRILNAESNLTLETVARIYYAFGCRPSITERTETYAISEAISENHIYVKNTISPQNSYIVVNS